MTWVSLRELDFLPRDWFSPKRTFQEHRCKLWAFLSLSLRSHAVSHSLDSMSQEQVARPPQSHGEKTKQVWALRGRLRPWASSETARHILHWWFRTMRLFNESWRWLGFNWGSYYNFQGLCWKGFLKSGFYQALGIFWWMALIIFCWGYRTSSK